MKSRTLAVIVWLAVFALHATTLLLAYVLAFSGVASHGPTSGPSATAQFGVALATVLGFPFLDLTQMFMGSLPSAGWLLVSAVLTSATWASVVTWFVLRRRARTP